MQIYSLKEMGIFVRNGIEHNNHVIYTFMVFELRSSEKSELDIFGSLETRAKSLTIITVRKSS